MKCRKLIKQVTCLALIVSLISATTLTAFATMSYDQYEVEAIITGSGETTQLIVLNVEGSAYISVEAAAELSGMEYSKNNSGDYIFSKGRHQVTYDGQTKEVDGVTYLRMQNAMDQLSCQYGYSPSLEAIVFEPTEDFIEDLQFDCNAVFERFDLSWVEEVPFAKETVRLYGFFTDGWNLKYLLGGDRREQYENTLWGIMVPAENESTLLSIADDGNKVVKSIYNIAEYSDEILSLDLTEIGLLIPEDFLNTYKTINNLVPGMSVSDYLGLLDKAYGSQYASTLYANSVKYGLYNNPYIEDMQLDAALKNTEKYFNGDTLLLQSFMEDWAANYLEKGIEDLSEAAIEETFSYNNIAIKMFSFLTDEVLEMKKNTGAVLALIDCAEIQQEAVKQYKKSLKHMNLTDAILTMKYSSILYLRACEYGYEKYKSTGGVGQDCYEIMQPLTSAMIKRIASYSDDELTREIRNKNLDFSLTGFTLINEEMQEGVPGVPSYNIQENLAEGTTFNANTHNFSETSGSTVQVSYAVDMLGKNQEFLNSYLGEDNLHFVELSGGNAWGFAYGSFNILTDYEWGKPTNPYWVFEIYNTHSPDNKYILDNEDIITHVYPGSEHLFPLAQGIYADMSDSGLKAAAEQYGYEYVENLCSDYDVGKTWIAQKEIILFSNSWEIIFSRYINHTYIDVHRNVTMPTEVDE